MLDEFYLYDRVISGSEMEKLAGLREKIDESAVREIFLHTAHKPSMTARHELQGKKKLWGSTPATVGNRGNESQVFGDSYFGSWPL